MKVSVITGANTGIGEVTARELAREGRRVVFACRSEERARAAMARVQAETGSDALEFLSLDLGSLASVASATDELLSRGHDIDLLINNAGLAGAQGITKDGYEVHFGVNHLGHFLWTQRLLPALGEGGGVRIVNVASRAHTRVKGINYDALRSPTKSRAGFREYCVSKLANVLYSHELSKRLPEGVTTCALHPGVIASDIWRRLPGPIRWVALKFMKTSEEGAQTTLMCATDPGLEGVNGRYYSEGEEMMSSEAGRDDAQAATLWAYSEEAVSEYL